MQMCFDLIDFSLYFATIILSYNLLARVYYYIPHLIYVASQEIDVGDQLLFDYNDRQSPMPFLKACPDCDDQPTTSSRHSAPAPAVSTVPDTGRKRASETAQDTDEQDHTRRPQSSARCCVSCHVYYF